MKKYFNFNGVAKRQEYWAVHIIAVLTMTIGFIILSSIAGFSSLVALAFFIATLWAILATTARRLRDAGLSTWWILALFVPYVAFVAQIVFGCVGSKKAE